MFESLQNSLSSALRTLAGKAKLTESNMREGLDLVRTALLEADVNIDVVKTFMSRVSEEALGEKVLNQLNPTQQLVGVVHQELVNLMGPVDHALPLRGDLPVLMLCGLQGSGKTTTCGKLGRFLKEQKRKPFLVAADLQRPAAIHQLQVLGEQLGIPVHADLASQDPVAVCQAGLKKARQAGADVVILDTAGRLHIDQELMEQLKRIDQKISPQGVYLVVDAMTGQDAVTSAKAFNEALELDGVIMTKLDGDARGGAALSVKQVTNVPIKYIGVGEHLDALEEFHPDRMAGRILGMGDMMSLVEKAQKAFDQDEMQRQQERLAKGQFTLDDFRKLLQQTTRLGPMQKVLGLLPGMGGLREMMQNEDMDGEMRRLGGVIDSMTPEERRNPSKFIDQSRRRRIAAGAGVEPHVVNELVKQFDAMASMMKRMSGKGPMEQARAMQELQRSGMLNPGAAMRKEKKDTGKRLTTEERNRLKKERERQLRKKKREEKNR